MENLLQDFVVNSRQSFARFLELLLKDYHENSDQWENNTLDRFLEAMSAYANDIQGYYENTGQNVNADSASWQVFADIFRGARVYE
jgi:hypothetical protein